MMIITTGKRVAIEILGGILLERDCETPHGVKVTRQTDGVDVSIWLPVYDEGRANFIAAYERICAEEIEYRKQEVETVKPTTPQEAADIDAFHDECANGFR